MSTDVEINLIAYDEASSVVESFGATMSATFQNVEGETQNLTSTTDAATSQMQLDYEDLAFSTKALNDAQGGASQSFGTSVMAMNNLALAGSNLYMSFERVENAQVALDRANLMVQRSTLELEKAQTAYNDAVSKFGVDSPEAQAALEKLNIAQTALQVSQERADMSTRNMNNAMLTSALTVIPSLISIVGAVSHAQEIWTGIQWALNAAMDANPIALVVLAIAGLVAAILVAWNYCPPFRDAILAVAGALGGGLSVAANAVTQALMWFWQNILQPIANFIITVFIANIQVLSDVWNAFAAAWNVVCASIGGFWNTYIKPIVDFIVTVFIMNIKGLMVIWQDAQNAWNALCTAISVVWNAAVGPVVSAIKWFADTVNGIFHTLFGWIIGGSVWVDLCNGLGTIWNNVVGPLINAISGFVSAVLGFFQGLQGALGSIWNSITGAVSSAWNTISSTVSNAVSGMASTITNWASGAASAVSNVLSGAGSAISTAVSGAASAVGTVAAAGVSVAASAVSTVGSALGTAASAVGTAMGTVASAVQGGLASAGSAISNFIGSICFAHALQGAADSSAKTMSGWTDMISTSMDKGLEEIKDFNAQIGVAGMSGGASVALGSAPLQGLTPAGRGQVSIQITAPLVNIEGSADKATVDLAAKQVLGQLKTVIVEPTSYGASSTQKRIRKGSLNIA